MEIVHFTGVVLPSGAQVSIGDLPIQVLWKEPDLNLDVTFSILIKSSVIDVMCEVRSHDGNIFSQLGMRAIKLARDLVNMSSFAVGTALSVSIDRFVNARGESNNVYLQETYLPALCDSFAVNMAETGETTNYAEILSILFADPSLSLALNDHRSSSGTRNLTSELRSGSRNFAQLDITL